jgi:hypothetical protein
MKRTIFWDVTPYSPIKVHRSVGGTYCFMPSIFLAYFSTPKMEAACSSEIFVNVASQNARVPVQFSEKLRRRSDHKANSLYLFYII